MNLDDLRSIRNEERQTDSLQPLPESFYADAGAYLSDLRDERERVADERGFDAPEFRRLSDEIDAAEDTVESIYERRVGKVVKAASLEAAGMAAQDEGLTTEERALFETLVEEITANRERVLAVLGDTAETGSAASPADARPGDAVDAIDEGADGTVPSRAEPSSDAAETASSPAEPPSEGTGDDPGDEPGPAGSDDAVSPDAGRDGPPATGTDATETPSEGTVGDDRNQDQDQDQDLDAPAGDDTTSDGGSTATDDTEIDPGPETTDVDRATLQITRDVGEILGVDERAYDLARGDVVTLPEENAAPLLDRDAAERLE